MRPPARLNSSLFALALLVVSSHEVTVSTACADEPQLLAQPRADYAARRKELMKRIREKEGSATANGQGPVVFLKGGDDEGKEDFEEGRFRQKNNFAYLTGVDIPAAYLILLPAEDRETLYLSPSRSHPVMNGESKQPVPGSGAAEMLGFGRVESTSKLLGDLFTAIGDPMKSSFRSRQISAPVVYTLQPHGLLEAISPEDRFLRFVKQGAPTATYKDLTSILGEMRKTKSPAELDLLKKAIAITGDANEEVIKIIQPGLFEYQLEAKITAAFTNGGALRSGFAAIIGSGPNGTIPHYFANSRKMEDGELVVVDIGAEYQLYTADITRTYPVNGKFTSRQRELYQLVLDAQTEAAKQIKPNETPIAAMTSIAAEYMRKSPLRAKDTDGKEYTMNHFFIHGLGHYLGMDVHDVGDIMKPIKVGEVFTIEPGVYIKSENIGIRIEDDYLMTENGPVKLSKDIAFEPDEIERKIAKARQDAGKK